MALKPRFSQQYAGDVINIACWEAAGGQLRIIAVVKYDVGADDWPALVRQLNDPLARQCLRLTRPDLDIPSEADLQGEPQ